MTTSYACSTKLNGKSEKKSSNFLPYPDVKLILTSFCLHRTIDDMYVIIIKYKADVRYYDLRDIKNIDVVIRSDGIYAVL